jgi:hypothetical protein
MALVEPSQVVGLHDSDVSLIDFAIGQFTCLDEFAQPRRRERVDLVVVDSHSTHHHTVAPAQTGRHRLALPIHADPQKRHDEARAFSPLDEQEHIGPIASLQVRWRGAGAAVDGR